jgi:mRNA-degrading endonuclease toxin of MazEF toxin-antitoxin module
VGSARSDTGFRDQEDCLIVGTNVLNERRSTVVVVPFSTAPQAAPLLLVPVVCAGRRAVAVLDQIRAVSKQRLDRRIAELPAEQLAAVEEALRLALEL